MQNKPQELVVEDEQETVESVVLPLKGSRLEKLVAAVGVEHLDAPEGAQPVAIVLKMIDGQLEGMQGEDQPPTLIHSGQLSTPKPFIRIDVAEAPCSRQRIYSLKTKLWSPPDSGIQQIPLSPSDKSNATIHQDHSDRG